MSKWRLEMIDKWMMIVTVDEGTMKIWTNESIYKWRDEDNDKNLWKKEWDYEMENVGTKR